jgi:hypothetical protein
MNFFQFSPLGIETIDFHFSSGANLRIIFLLMTSESKNEMNLFWMNSGKENLKLSISLLVRLSNLVVECQIEDNELLS